MRRNLKKIIVSILAFIILFNNFSTIVVYATAEDSNTSTEKLEEKQEEKPKEKEETEIENKKEEITVEKKEEEKQVEDESKDKTNEQKEKQEDKETVTEEKKEQLEDKNVTKDIEKKIAKGNKLDKSTTNKNAIQKAENSTTKTDSLYSTRDSLPYIYPDAKPSDFNYSETTTGVNNHEGSITKKIGERGFYTRIPQHIYRCNNCKSILSEYIPDYYCDINIGLTQKSEYNEVKIDDIKFTKGYNGNYTGLKTEYTPITPGEATVKIQYYTNFCVEYVRVWCNCGKYVYINKNYKWYKYTDTFDLKVNADYNLVYDTGVSEEERQDISNMPSSETKTVAETSAKFSISNKIPYREGYSFLGWSDIPNDTKVKYKLGNNIKLEWEEGLGSEDNPVSKTLYAVWEQIDIEYKVEWYDIEGNKIKPDEYRTGNKFDTVSVTDEDKIIEGYTFIEDDTRNILSKELYGDTVLKLYFEKIKPEIEYKVEWYNIEGNKLKPDESRTGIKGNTVSVTDKDKTIEGYTFIKDYKENNLSQELNENTVLKLYFEKNEVIKPDNKKDEDIDKDKPSQEEIIEQIEEEDEKVIENNINTGDNNKTKLYAVLCLISLAVIFITLFLNKKEKNIKKVKNVTRKLMSIIIFTIIFSNVTIFNTNFVYENYTLIINNKDNEKVSKIDNSIKKYNTKRYYL